MLGTLIAWAAAAVIAVGVGGAQASPRGTVALDGIDTIIDAFRSHPIVGLAEDHGDEASHTFRLALIGDPRFPSMVNDIVVEFGNSRYQDVIDRFVGGATVSDDHLKRVWQDTTQPHTIWDRPIYEQFFRAVREINARLPRERRLRVLLGDPPVDWTSAKPNTK